MKRETTTIKHLTVTCNMQRRKYLNKHSFVSWIIYLFSIFGGVVVVLVLMQ